MADFSAGTGMGSSSSYTVALLKGLNQLKRRYISVKDIAEEACKIEIDLIGKPIGKQDQYIAAYGGFRYIQFNPDETVSTEPVMWSAENKEKLIQNLMLFYTGDVREASSILREQKENTRQSQKMETLRKMRDMALDLKDKLNGSAAPEVFGDVLHQGWLLKKQLARKFSNLSVYST